MWFPTLEAAPGGYDHIYIAPHLDDAAFSCGGLIAKQVEAGRRVLAVTLSTAAPSPDGPFNEIAQFLHQMWGVPAERAMDARATEEQQALIRLGCDGAAAGQLDAIYRRPGEYYNHATLFGPTADEPEYRVFIRQMLDLLRERSPWAVLYAPLAIGRHVDHQIVYETVQEHASGPLMFYEDFPYVYEQGALEERLAGFTVPLAPQTVAIDALVLRKLDAMGVYTSQLPDLFGGLEPMIDRVLNHCRTRRPAGGVFGERYWRRASEPEVALV